MCRSPDEWTTKELEDHIQAVQRFLDGRLIDSNRRYYEGRLEMMEALLKERAEQGAYLS